MCPHKTKIYNSNKSPLYSNRNFRGFFAPKGGFLNFLNGKYRWFWSQWQRHLRDTQPIKTNSSLSRNVHIGLTRSCTTQLLLLIYYCYYCKYYCRSRCQQKQKHCLITSVKQHCYRINVYISACATTAANTVKLFNFFTHVGYQPFAYSPITHNFNDCGYETLLSNFLM